MNHYPSSILQDRGWKHPACHLSHVIFHLDPKLLDVRVQVEVSVLHLWTVKDIHHISQKSQSYIPIHCCYISCLYNSPVC